MTRGCVLLGDYKDNLNNLLKLKQKYHRKLAKWRLIWRYEYLIQVNGILEEYLTQRILAGGSAEFLGKSRSDLVAKQQEIKETEKMVEFLRSIK